MAKAELGEKQLCPSCGAKFYDLGRRPATCPKCATSFDPAEEGVRLKRVRSKTPASYEDEEEAEAEGAKKVVADEDEEEVEVTPGIDVAEADPIVTDDDEDGEPAGDELPPGFSEEEAELADAGDEDVPLLDDEEEFPEDEIGDLPGSDEEDSGR